MSYYNSDLSKYIGQKLLRKFTSIDVDILQIKHSRNLLRFIESKHERESLKVQQAKALKTLAWIARTVNKNPSLFNRLKMEVYEVRGNEPYDEITVYDFITGKSYKLNDRQKIDGFLSVEYDLTDADKTTNQ
jgi:hypothetical protein